MRTVFFLLFALLALPALAQPSLTLDLTSGRVLQQKQEFDPWHPASLTKLMTAYVIFREIEAKRLTLNDPVVFTTEAAKAPPSKINYRPGTTLTIDNALKLLIIKSANDVSIALAQKVAGTVSAFADMMNAEAEKLGMSGSKWVNPHGLHDARQITTARDMALLLRAIHQKFPQYSKLFTAPSLIAPQFLANGKTRPKVHFTFNLLLERFTGADGFKTGFVCASGYNFAGSATRNGRRIAAIVLGRDGQTSRAVDAAKLIAEGFKTPANSGIPLTQLTPNGPVAAAPRNMRPVLCTPQARKERYDPPAGQADITSPWLEARRIERLPLTVALLPRSTVPPSLRKIPLPTFRPASKKGEVSSTIKSIEGVLAREILQPQATQTQTQPQMRRPTFRPRQQP